VIERANPAYCRMLGYTEEELRGKHLKDITHPEVIEENLRKQAQLGRGEIDHYVMEKKFIHKQGHTLYGILVSNLIRDAKGKPLYFLGSVLDITDRKRAEDALLENEEKYRSLFDNSKDAILLTTPDGTILDANPAACKIFGRSLEEIRRIGRDGLVDTTDPRLHAAVKQRELKGEETAEITMLRANGEKFSAEISSKIYLDAKGRRKTSMIIRDMTERRKMEEEYRTLFRTMLDGFAVHEIICDAQGQPVDYRFLVVNPAFERMTGLKAENIVGRTVLEVLPETERLWIETYGRVALTGVPAFFESYAQSLDKYFEVSAFRSAPNRFVTVFADITGRKKAEKKLEESETLYRKLFEDHTAVKLMINPDTGDIIDANEAAGNFYGWSRDQLRQMKIQDINTLPPAEIKKEMEKARTRKKVYFEFRHRRADGSIRDVEVFSSKIVAQGKDVLHSIVHDITERRQAEKALRERDILFKKLSFHVPGMIYQFMRKPDGTYCFPFVTDAIKNIFDCSPEDVRDDFSPIAKTIFPDDLNKVINSIECSAEQMIKWECEYRVQLPGQPVRWMLGQSTPEKLAGGSIIWHGFNADITDKKLAEDALRASEEKYRFLTEAMTDIVWMANIDDLRTTYVSPSIENLLGFTPEERKRQSVEEQLTPDSLSWALNALAEELTREKQDDTDPARTIERELEFYHKDGSTRWMDVVISGIRNEQGVLTGIHGVARDVTERKHAEENLRRTLESLRKAVGATIQVMVSAVEARDPYTAGHQVRSADLARAIATEMELPPEKIDGIRMAGAIHDIGKLSVPAEILTKPTRLTDLEHSLVKEHAKRGYEMLKNVESMWPLAQIVYQHHERMDGSGYPQGLKGEDIILEARIMAVADVVESMASHRPYRASLGLEEALREIEKNKKILYDEAVVSACLRLFREKGYRLPEV
jgi:PAS domain S-box-containing protein